MRKISDFDYIYQTYSNGVYRYLLILTQDAQLSEELTQETFYQAIKSIHRFKEKCSIYTWLCSIAKNSFKTYLHKNKKYQLKDPEFFLQISEDKQVVKEEGLYQMISHLKSPYREIVQLHIYDQISLKEIAKQMNKSESFARVTFHRAKLMLKKEWEKNEM